LARNSAKRRLLNLLVLILFIFGGMPAVYATPEIPEVEIPVEPISEVAGEVTEPVTEITESATEITEPVTEVTEEVVQPEVKEERTVGYTEDLWDITEAGVFDIFGNVRQTIEEATPPDQEVAPTAEEEAATAFEAYKQSIIESWGGKKTFAEKRLEGIKENLSDQMKRFNELESSIAQAQEKITPLREQVSTLQGQIRLLNTQLQTAKDQITNTEILIAEKKIEIKDLMLNLKKSEIEMGIQKNVVTDYVKLLYGEEQQYLNLYDDGSSTLKLLLADASVSENLMGQEYMKVMEETGRKVFYDLEVSNRQLQEKQKTIVDEETELEFLHTELLKEKRALEETRLSKKDLLEQTQGEEEKYQLMLEQAIQEQLDTAIAVQNLQENIELINSKLDTLDDGLSEVKNAEAPADFTGSQENVETIEGVENKAEVLTQEQLIDLKPFAWPVPANKITAFFHDPTYPARWGIHNAIDIRAKQFTEIKAPANGYVFQTKDNGNGYNYIIIAHKNNLVTVYGHVSQIIAKAGTIVKKGDVIGLSGGTPGTKGAGLQTTGPHLHFEVHYKGEAVNPLDYLPLDDMPIEYVPDEYLKDLQ
jgi:murein DD-endopeptidase MepM/ murein hydrolase activator NlpD